MPAPSRVTRPDACLLQWLNVESTAPRGDDDWMMPLQDDGHYRMIKRVVSVFYSTIFPLLTTHGSPTQKPLKNQ